MSIVFGAGLFIAGAVVAIETAIVLNDLFRLLRTYLLAADELHPRMKSLLRFGL